MQQQAGNDVAGSAREALAESKRSRLGGKWKSLVRRVTWYSWREQTKGERYEIVSCRYREKETEIRNRVTCRSIGRKRGTTWIRYRYTHRLITCFHN